MERIRTQDTADRIGQALALVPPRIREWIGDLDFFEGDAAFAGLCDGGTFESGWSHQKGRVIDYRDSAYYAWSAHQRFPARSQRTPTVVLPSRYAGARGVYPHVYCILHELGHALEHALTGEARERDRIERRLLWHPADREVSWWWGYPGLFPGVSRPLSDYHPERYGEQFAEAFAMWLHPSVRTMRDELLATAFYAPDARGRLDLQRRYPSNRRLLAFLNGLAGWPWDRRPAALRGL